MPCRLWAEEFARAHNQAVENLGSAPYRVFMDLRTMAPRSSEAASIIEQAKAFSTSRPGFQGSAVLVASQIIVIQHRRTSTTGGVINTELISDDEEACRAHLRSVSRRSNGR